MEHLSTQYLDYFDPVRARFLSIIVDLQLSANTLFQISVKSGQSQILPLRHKKSLTRLDTHQA